MATTLGNTPLTTEMYSKQEVDAAVAGARPADYDAVKQQVAGIAAKIPVQASTSNQLADKAFVNSSIATNTANYISYNGGPFPGLAELETYEGALTNNDYAFVVGTDSAGNTTYTRYKYNAFTETWAAEYVLNNSSFTAAQWAAISSGITSGDVQKLRALPTAAELATVLAGKANTADVVLTRQGDAWVFDYVVTDEIKAWIVEQLGYDGAGGWDLSIQGTSLYVGTINVGLVGIAEDGKTATWRQGAALPGMSAGTLIAHKAQSGYVLGAQTSKVLAGAVDLGAHVDDGTIHVTAAEKTAWSNKADTSDIPTNYLKSDQQSITSAGVNTDWLINPSLNGGPRVRYSSTTPITNYTEYSYDQIRVMRGGLVYRFYLDQSLTNANGIVKRSELTAINNTLANKAAKEWYVWGPSSGRLPTAFSDRTVLVWNASGMGVQAVPLPSIASGVAIEFYVAYTNDTSAATTLDFSSSDTIKIFVKTGEDLQTLTTFAAGAKAMLRLFGMQWGNDGVVWWLERTDLSGGSSAMTWSLNADGTVSTEGELNADGTLTVEGTLNADGTLTVEAQ